MEKTETYDEPSDVSAKDGQVHVDGPDSVDVILTPEAAEESGERLVEEATKAAGQRRLSGLNHKPR